jgi:hypothetical protein
MERDVEAIKSAEGDVAETVHSIQQEGCHQYSSHRSTLEVLEGSGAILGTDGPREGFVLPKLNNRQKAVAGIGVVALLVPAVSDLFKVITAMFAWLQAVHSMPK